MKLNKKKNRFIFFSTASLFFLTALSIPSDYFMFPIKPGEPNLLSGNMGELRSNHFHAGIDIKTEGVEGLPVIAAADGHVYRIKISGYGYGNVLYLKHPNGYVTVYAHLKDFSPEIAEYIKNAQYKRQKFSVHLFPEADQFQFEKGDTIAFSGNTGSSGGPHLHFEIRDENHHVVNPLQFDFPELTDKTPPIPFRLAFTPKDIMTRIDGRFQRSFKSLIKRNGTYSLREPLEVWGLFGIELQAFDYMDDAPHKYGVQKIKVELDGKSIYNSEIQEFAFAETRILNTHINYLTRIKGQGTYQRLYIEDGNRLRFYETAGKSGLIKINDTKKHDVYIELTDAFGNTEHVEFILKGKKPVRNIKTQIQPRFRKGFHYEIIGNTLKIIAGSNYAVDDASLYINNNALSLTPAYRRDKDGIYLWDLRKGLPDSIHLREVTKKINLKHVLYPDDFNQIEQEDYSIIAEGRSLFDTVYLKVGENKANEKYFHDRVIGSATIPFYSYLQIKLKANENFTDPSKVAAYIHHGNWLQYKGGKWKGDFMVFKTRYLGRFILAEDTEAPRIRKLRSSSSELRFIIRDNMSGISNFDAYLDGEWILMNYDPKYNLIYADPLENGEQYSGKLELKVTDNCNNTNTLKLNL